MKLNYKSKTSIKTEFVNGKFVKTITETFETPQDFVISHTQLSQTRAGMASNIVKLQKESEMNDNQADIMTEYLEKTDKDLESYKPMIDKALLKIKVLQEAKKRGRKKKIEKGVVSAGPAFKANKDEGEIDLTKEEKTK